MDAKASARLDVYLNRLLESERELLPRRKQRALEEMTIVLKAYRQEASRGQNQKALDFFSKFQRNRMPGKAIKCECIYLEPVD
jgi:hypothetical protein